MTSLDFNGFVDADFKSYSATQITVTGSGYDDDGIWQEGTESESAYDINVQPVSNREIQSLQIGGERISDYRNIWVNDGDFHALSPSAFWEFDANNNGLERYKIISSDIRVSRSYAKLTVCLIDS